MAKAAKLSIEELREIAEMKKARIAMANTVKNTEGNPDKESSSDDDGEDEDSKSNAAADQEELDQREVAAPEKPAEERKTFLFWFMIASPRSIPHPLRTTLCRTLAIHPCLIQSIQSRRPSSDSKSRSSAIDEFAFFQIFHCVPYAFRSEAAQSSSIPYMFT